MSSSKANTNKKNLQKWWSDKEPAKKKKKKKSEMKISNGFLPGMASKALCQGSTFSLACHDSDTGWGGCVRGCVRQQVQLGLPR